MAILGNGNKGSIGGIQSQIDKTAFDKATVLKWQPWLNVEAAAGAGSPYEFIQPRSGWLEGHSVSTYHLKVQISFLNNCTLIFESSPTEEGPWTEVLSYTEQTDIMTVISSEGGTARFSGYVRWRVTGTPAYQICFQLEAVPGASIASYIATPKKI